MATLFDYKTGKWQYVPDENIETAVGGGDFQFGEGIKVPVVNPNGEATEIDARDATEAFRTGYRYRGMDETRTMVDAEINRNYQAAMEEVPLGQLSAGVFGALSGRSFGLTDLVMRGIGEATDTDVAGAVRTLEEAYPTTTLAGELIGGLGFKKLGGELVRGVSRGAEALGARTGAGLLSTAAQMGKSGKTAEVMASGLRSATTLAAESAAYEAGRLVSRAALDDPELTMENAALSMGLSALVGGGIGFGLGTLGKGAQQFVKAIEDHWASGGRVPVVDKIAEDVMPKIYRSMKSHLTKEEGDLVEEVFKNRTKGKAVIDAMRDPEGIANRMTEGLSKAFDGSKDLMTIAAELSEPGLKKLASKGNATTVTRELKDYGRIKKAITRQFKKWERETALYGPGTRTAVEETLAKIDAGIAKAQTKADMHVAIDEGKEYLKSVIKSKGGYAGGSVDTNVKALREFEGELNKHLKNPKLYSGYSTQYSDVKSSMARFLQAREKVFGKMAQTESKAKAGPLGRIDMSSGAQRLEVDRAKVQALLWSPEAKAKSRDLWAALDEYWDAANALRNTTEGYASKLNADPAILQQITTIQQNADAVAKALADARANRTAAVILNRIESKTGRSLLGPTSGAAMAGTVGTVLGGPVGGVIGTGLGTLAGTLYSNPLRVLAYTARADFVNQTATGRTLNAVRQFLSPSRTAPTRQVLRQGARWGIAEAAQYLGIDRKRGETRETTLARGLSAYRQSPALLEQHVRQAFPGLHSTEAAPLYAAAVNQAQRAVEFLGSKVPEMPMDDILGPGEIKLPPSQAARIEAYSRAVMNPEILYDEMKTGNIQPETVEAVKAVYPKLYEQLRTQVMDHIASHPRKLDYARKLQLGILFDAPVTTGLQNLATLSDWPEPQPPQTRSSAPSRAAQSNLTASQQLERRFA